MVHLIYEHRTNVWNKLRNLFTRKTDAQADETPSGKKRHSRKGSRRESVRGNRRSHRSTAEDEITEDDRFNEPGEFTEVEEERRGRPSSDGRRYIEADDGGREEGPLPRPRDSVELHESTRQSASLRRRSSRDYEIEPERAPGPRSRGESWNEVGARARSRTSSVVGSPRKGRSSIGFREPPMVSGSEPDFGRNEKVQYVKRSYEEGRRRSPENREAHAKSDEKDNRSPKTRRSSVVPRRLTQQVSLPRSEPGYRTSPRRKPASSYEDEGRARSAAHSLSSSRSGRISPRALSLDQNAPRTRTLSTKSAEIPIRHSQHQRRHLTMSDVPSPRGSDGSYSPRRPTTRRLAVNGSRLAAESGSHSSSEERSRSTVTGARRDRYRGDLRAGDYPSREAPPVVKLSLQSLKKKAAEGRTMSRVRSRADVAVDEPVYEWGSDGEEDAELDRPAFMKPQYYV
jgi:hypothetical protein